MRIERGEVRGLRGGEDGVVDLLSSSLSSLLKSGLLIQVLLLLYDLCGGHTRELHIRRLWLVEIGI